MTNEQILKKAIEKAIKNGYKNLVVDDVFPITMNEMQWEGFWRTLIFSHDFAKAFWGKSKKCLDCGLPIKINLGCGKEKWGCVWEKHLRTMVLEKKPLKYLEKFL